MLWRCVIFELSKAYLLMKKDESVLWRCGIFELSKAPLHVSSRMHRLWRCVIFELSKASTPCRNKSYCFGDVLFLSYLKLRW